MSQYPKSLFKSCELATKYLHHRSETTIHNEITDGEIVYQLVIHVGFEQAVKRFKCFAGIECVTALSSESLRTRCKPHRRVRSPGIELAVQNADGKLKYGTPADVTFAQCGSSLPVSLLGAHDLAIVRQWLVQIERAAFVYMVATRFQCGTWLGEVGNVPMLLDNRSILSNN